MMTTRKNNNSRKPLKRSNGQGTVYKLSGRRRKPWIARVTIGWDDNGKQLYQTIGYFETKQDAIDALAIHKIAPISPKADTTLEELYTEWNESKFQYISKSTIDGYKAAWKRFSSLYNLAIKDIRTSHLQKIIDTEYNSGGSRSTLEKIKSLAFSLYEYAMQNDILNKNYAEFITLPKLEKEEKEKFSDIEIAKIEKCADSVPWVDTIMIFIYTGMRISELLNLTKFNVDLDNQLITGGVKTEAGKNRIIPIHPKILPYIKKWYDKNGERLICNEEGKRILPKYYREKLYYPTLESIGVRKLNPHCCRHTFASLMAKAGVDPLYIQKIIGHAKYSTTADKYTHTDIDELKSAITKIG